MASAVTISGLVMKDRVAALPSLRPGKLRLNDDTMVFVWLAPTSDRFHWPMHGPHALASTVPPSSSKVFMMPSRLMVWNTRSEPGVIRNLLLALAPAFSAWLAM